MVGQTVSEISPMPLRLSRLSRLALGIRRPPRRGGAEAAPAKVVVAYQTGPDPIEVAIASGEIAKATGREVEFRKFNSGADIFAAIASGDVQVGYVGSSPFAAAASRGLDVKAFYVSSISGTDEALVVRDGSGIASPADLKGKRLSAAPVSTDHYQLLATLKQNGIPEKDATVLALPQPEIVAAWKRGDLDGAFVWDPALSELKKNGHGAAHLEAGGRARRADLQRLGGDRRLHQGGSRLPEELRGRDRQGERLLPERQGGLDGGVRQRQGHRQAARRHAAGPGGGPQGPQPAARLRAGHRRTGSAAARTSGVARILKDTAGFLKEQRKITAVRDGYGGFVTAEFVAPLSN